MPNYQIRSYRSGDEIEQVEIDRQVVSNWLWPFGYTLDGMQRAIEHPDFDPNTRLYCFEHGDMVGHTFAEVHEPDEDGKRRASLWYPRVLPGHEAAIELLLENALERLRVRKVDIAETRASTMWPGSFELMTSLGYRETVDRPRGYKVYATYDLTKGQLPWSTAQVTPFDVDRDLDEAARLAAIWYRRPVDACRAYLKELHQDPDTIAQLVLRRGDQVVAACAVAANYLRRDDLAALFYVYAQDVHALRPLIAGAIERSTEAGFETLLVDLIYAHRHFEPAYLDMGFTQAAEWGLYENLLR